MNLPLDIVRTTGRAPTQVTSEVLRPLGDADIALLAREKGSTTPPLKRIRDRHHAAARLLSAGISEGQVAAITGYDVSRISILKNDPAFRELLEFYRGHVDAAYVDLHEQLAGMSKDALVMLRERMEEEPEKITLLQLIELTKMGADRTGYGPTQKVEQNVNINLANRLDQARARLRDRQIDIMPNKENACGNPAG